MKSLNWKMFVFLCALIAQRVASMLFIRKSYNHSCFQFISVRIFELWSCVTLVMNFEPLSGPWGSCPCFVSLEIPSLKDGLCKASLIHIFVQWSGEEIKNKKRVKKKRKKESDGRRIKLQQVISNAHLNKKGFSMYKRSNLLIFTSRPFPHVIMKNNKISR